MTPHALNSHNPFSFAVKPQITHDGPRFTATKLQCVSNYKLRIESAREEPRLRNLLGHISIYDNVREWFKDSAVPKHPPQTELPSDDITDCRPQDQTNELQTYLHHVPSFQDFQAAIEVQLATMAQITAATHQLTVDEYESASDGDDDSDYDSYDGDDAWDDEDAGSDESLTDVELETPSECNSPTSDGGFEDKECQDDYFALRPLTPLMTQTVQVVHF